LNNHTEIYDKRKKMRIRAHTLIIALRAALISTSAAGSNWLRSTRSKIVGRGSCPLVLARFAAHRDIIYKYMLFEWTGPEFSIIIFIMIQVNGNQRVIANILLLVLGREK
jgi:hypothetical protein